MSGSPKRRQFNTDYQMSQDAVAAEIGVSRKVVDQIERSALRKLRLLFEQRGWSPSLLCELLQRTY